MFSFFLKKQVDPQKELKAVVGQYQLPQFPAVIMRALRLLRQPDCELPKVAKVLAADPGITVMLLNQVNSAAYSLRARVSSVSHASSLLGRSRLEQALLAVAVKQALPSKAAPGFRASEFWHVSAQRASIAKELASLIHPSQKDEAFTAALLQEMAVPMLAHAKIGEYGDLLESWNHRRSDLATTEKEAFGWDHAEVATWMCSRWQFPEGLAEVIGGHHGTDPLLTTLPAVQLVGDIRTARDKQGIEELVEKVFDEYGIAHDKVIERVEASTALADEYASMFASV